MEENARDLTFFTEDEEEKEEEEDRLKLLRCQFIKKMLRSSEKENEFYQIMIFRYRKMNTRSVLRGVLYARYSMSLYRYTENGTSP
jgi:hypothetical protein